MYTLVWRCPSTDWQPVSLGTYNPAPVASDNLPMLAGLAGPALAAWGEREPDDTYGCHMRIDLQVTAQYLYALAAHCACYAGMHHAGEAVRAWRFTAALSAVQFGIAIGDDMPDGPEPAEWANADRG